ncbi:hypothetical protein BDQ12DRAFT_670541 [Crucibulum laeve]|uniref:Uncharacterized protein n=1 Tax=Crucibulum laeve TaxID=68775 RepID=A0A5C3LK74_9AGAR|nr:hypothetical protein BDQ12DRAFT_670541 [Crucibulum laeve]
MLRIFTGRNKKRSADRPSSSRSDWLSNAITFGKALQTAGDFAPFPYIQGAASILVALLVLIQQMYKNRDDYKCLTESIVTVLKQLEEDVLQNPTAALASEPFKEQCKEVETFLPSKMNGFKEMWSSSSLRDFIAQCQRDVDKMCINLILRNTNHMRIHLEGNNHALTQSTEKGDSQSSVRTEDHLELSNHRHYLIGDLQLLPGHYSSDPGVDVTYAVALPDVSGRKTAKLSRGKDAYKKWKSQFNILSQIRRDSHPHIQQIFGIIPSKNHPICRSNYWKLINAYKDAKHYLEWQPYQCPSIFIQSVGRVMINSKLYWLVWHVDKHGHIFATIDQDGEPNARYNLLYTNDKHSTNQYLKFGIPLSVIEQAGISN